MSMSNFLRPLRTGVYQVHINDRVAAVLRWVQQFGDVPHRYEIFVEDGDEIVSLGKHYGTAVVIARQIAEGKFDNDFRFEVRENPEPSWQGDRHFVTQIATPSQKVIDSWTSEDGFAAVASAREAQMYSLEERWEMDFECEMQERAY